MLSLRKKISKFLWAAFFAVGFLYFTTFIFNVAPSLLAATIFNFALIILFLIEDLVAEYFVARYKLRNRDKQPSAFMRIFLSYFDSVSFKTSLYLFYIAILICSAIDTAEPDIFNDYFSLYLLTIEYGILVLVATDSFLGQFFKDISMREQEAAADEHK